MIQGRQRHNLKKAVTIIQVDVTGVMPRNELMTGTSTKITQHFVFA